MIIMSQTVVGVGVMLSLQVIFAGLLLDMECNVSEVLRLYCPFVEREFLMRVTNLFLPCQCLIGVQVE